MLGVKITARESHSQETLVRDAIFTLLHLFDVIKTQRNCFDLHEKLLIIICTTQFGD